VEIEHGGVEWTEHYIDIYSRIYRIEIVRYRGRRCRRVWEEQETAPISDFRLVRTINLKE
jgi:hypothetical protein